MRVVALVNCETSTHRELSKANRSTARMKEDAPTSRSSGSGDVTPTQSSSSSGSTSKMSGHEGGDGCQEATKKRTAEEEHPEDPGRDDGKWMRTDGNKRKAGEESEESRLRKTVRYLKELDKMENKKRGGVRQSTGGRGGGGSRGEQGGGVDDRRRTTTW